MGKGIRDKSEEKMLKMSNEINIMISTLFNVSKNVNITLKIFLVAQLGYYVCEMYRGVYTFICLYVGYMYDCLSNCYVRMRRKNHCQQVIIKERVEYTSFLCQHWRKFQCDIGLYSEIVGYSFRACSVTETE